MTWIHVIIYIYIYIITHHSDFFLFTWQEPYCIMLCVSLWLIFLLWNYWVLTYQVVNLHFIFYTCKIFLFYCWSFFLWWCMWARIGGWRWMPTLLGCFFEIDFEIMDVVEDSSSLMGRTFLGFLYMWYQIFCCPWGFLLVDP
jgi:hypothetical protein